MRVYLDTAQLEKTLMNIVKYSNGFLEGAQLGKRQFLNSLGLGVIQALGQYIDTMARGNEKAMHHVYEWYQTGSPSARLFELSYTVSNLGLSLNSTFRQSSSVKQNSSIPFYDKAKIMENGIPVTIRPKKSGVLAFEVDGAAVFTSNEVRVDNPGGTQVKGEYERVFDTFFQQYFSQAFLRASGILDYIKNPIIYKKNFASGAIGGNSVGKKVGYTWITNAKIGIE
jgi:hypothetical protein